MQEYAQLMGVIDDIIRIFPDKKISPEDIVKASQIDAANVFGRTISNASPGRYRRVLKSVLDNAQKYGYKKDVDFQDLFEVNKIIEDVYGLQRSGSLGGIMRRQADVIPQQGSILGQALDTARSAAREKPEKAFEDFIQYLRSGAQ
jgi:hypothetical protein